MKAVLILTSNCPCHSATRYFSMSLTLSKKSRTDLPKNQDSPNFLRNFFLSRWGDIAYIRFPTIIILPVPLVFEKFTDINVSTILFFK
jgi:hypothetical protein